MTRRRDPVVLFAVIFVATFAATVAVLLTVDAAARR